MSKRTSNVAASAWDDFDLAIAAHAIAHDAAVVTRNTRHVVRIRSLRVEDLT
jgi:predicted nucleic acid-binding protein